MHFPRRLGWGALLALLLISSRPVIAQEAIKLPAAPPQPDAAPPINVLLVPANTTKRIEMSNKEIIKEVRNENPKVVRVQSIVDDPRAVLVTGIDKGTSRLTFTDANRKVELLEIRVPDDEISKLEEKRAQFLKLLHETVPTAAVNATVTGASNVILTGTAPNAETVQIILETARGMFGGAGAMIINGIRLGGVQQVQLEVVVALVNRSELRQMSFNTNIQGNRFFANSVVGTGGGGTLSRITSFLTAPIGDPAVKSVVASSPNINFGILGNNVSALGFLEALRTEGLAKIMAEPRVVTLSGRPAYIVSGGETPILAGGGTNSPSVSYKQFGTVVNFLPIVLGNGKIHLEVRPELSSINSAFGITINSGTTPTVVPGFSTRMAQVAVQIEDGQTLAIGGLIQNTINATVTKVPVLGDIPFLNTFFSAKNYSEQEEELLILVTPRLIDPMGCDQIPKYLPGRETRSPDDFELFLEGILEAPRGPRFVPLDPFHYKGAHLGSVNSALYPCPGGDCNGTGNGNGTAGGCANGQCGTAGGTLTAPPPASGNPYRLSTPPRTTAPAAGNVATTPAMQVPTRTESPARIIPPITDSVVTPRPTATPMLPGTAPAIIREPEGRPGLPPVSGLQGNPE